MLDPGDQLSASLPETVLAGQDVEHQAAAVQHCWEARWPTVSPASRFGLHRAI